MMLGDDLLDLRDVERCLEDDDEEGEEARLIAEVLKDETGQDLEWLAINEPTLIHESYFEDYTRDFAESIGAIERDGDWPTMYIDWTRAADDLKQDYSSFEINGHTYYGRTF